ncbi:MAG: FHA domain-containing protein [Polyangiaceae bacterium]
MVSDSSGEETLPTDGAESGGLVVRVAGPGLASRHSILRAKRYRVGRDPSADITTAHASVSREHAEIMVADDRLVVRDLGSKNGTMVAGVQVPAGERDAMSARRRDSFG